MTDLLPCTCGARGRADTRGLIFCTAGHTYCEAEDYTPEEWNACIIEYWKKRAPALRSAAKKMVADAKAMEQAIINHSKDEK